MTAQATTAWAASPEQWKDRLADAVNVARQLRDELELDGPEYYDVLRASLEAMRHHAIIAEQVSPLGNLPRFEIPRG